MSNFQPPRSPDLNPCDFFIWGDLKRKVYSVSIENEEQLWNRIQNAVQELQNEETETTALSRSYMKWSITPTKKYEQVTLR
ncbi:hypothetical protein NQ317_006892 [Molorchus minor]|uniref:Tc1-like transposase DDE domain-containing protein n=1 Tax=Molorchus minor TaxID=1323400 RepID=A0ABQ9JGB2_9CUCU|nr:hypothetical protein NQ317_006892 [Molorchus minor]